MKQSGNCARTGEKHCKCLFPKPAVSPLKVDLKAALRKLFTDHGVYTAFVLDAIVDGKDQAILQPYVKRLLQNQVDIGDLLKPLIGNDNGNLVTKLLQEHIKLAAATITSAATNDGMLEDNVAKLFANSDQVAAALTSLNPEKLPYDATSKMFHIHNQYVIDMCKAAIDGRAEDQIKLYDSYYNELLQMSDAIFDAL